MKRDSATEKKVSYFVLSREIYFCGVSVAARTQMYTNVSYCR